MTYGSVRSITFRIQPPDGPLDLSGRDRTDRFGEEPGPPLRPRPAPRKPGGRTNAREGAEEALA